jgi:signal-transduction protein with cAMP-binding, CBS, and nucleotidyltransferase domain
LVSTYQIRDVVPKRLVTIRDTKTVQEAAKLMMDEGRGDVIVVGESGAPLGILTERDVTYKVAALGLSPKEVSVVSVMSSPILTIQASFTLDEAIQLMAQRSVRRLLVMEGERSIGLLTEMDILGVQQKCGYCFKELSAVPGQGEVVVVCSCHTKYHRSCTETIVHCVYCGSTLVRGVTYSRPDETTSG